MKKGEKKALRRRLVRAYLSSILSISLVLLLVGVATLLIGSARSVGDYFRESMQLSVILKQETTSEQADAYCRSVQTLPYIKSARLVSREEGTQELKEMLGEDFLSVFETSPVPVSVELTLHSEYVSADSIAVVTGILEASDAVDEVNCQRSLVEALNANLARISLVLGIFILLLLFISFVLISNTVRLNIFSRRFTIHTMKLVGATRSFIRRPFIAASIWQGLASAFLALALLAGTLYLGFRSFGTLLEIFTVRSYVTTGATVLLTGILICVASTYFAVGKLISMSKDDLYY